MKLKLKKKEKKALWKISFSLLTLFFAYLFWIFLKSDDNLRTAIFQPALNQSIWISLIVFVLWFLLLYWFYKAKSSNKKWKYDFGFSRKMFSSIAFTVLTFWFVFALVDFVSTQTSLSSLINFVMQLDLLSGIIVFGLWFIGMVYLNKKIDKR